jgi:hypothetical protein
MLYVCPKRCFNHVLDVSRAVCLNGSHLRDMHIHWSISCNNVKTLRTLPYLLGVDRPSSLRWLLNSSSIIGPAFHHTHQTGWPALVRLTNSLITSRWKSGISSVTNAKRDFQHCIWTQWNLRNTGISYPTLSIFGSLMHIHVFMLYCMKFFLNPARSYCFWA